MLGGFLEIQRLLQPRRRRTALVVRDRHGRVGVLQRLKVQLSELRHGLRRDRPEQRVLDQQMEVRVVPDALVVAVRGVEDAALPVRAHPRPRLATGGVDAFHQDGFVRIDLGVDVGFVPHLKRLHAGHHRMVRLRDLGGELAGAVLLELRADERNVGLGILEAEGRRVDRQKRLAAGDEVEQRLFLLRRDLRVVRVDHQRVVPREIRRRSARRDRRCRRS